MLEKNEAILDGFTSRRRLSDQTFQTYYNALRVFDEICNVSLSQLTVDLVKELYNGMIKHEYSSSSIDLYLTKLRLLYRQHLEAIRAKKKQRETTNP